MGSGENNSKLQGRDRSNSSLLQPSNNPLIHSHPATSRKPSLLRNHSGYYQGSNGSNINGTNMGKRSSNGSHNSSGSNSGDSSAVNSPTLLSSSLNDQNSHNKAGKSTNSGGSVSSGGRSHAKAISSMLAQNLQHQNSLFVAQERAYIKKIRNQIVDDYYTKGITGADEYSKDSERDSNDNENDEDDYDYDEEEEGNTSLLVDMEDEVYQLDSVSATTLLENNINNLKINPNKNITHLNKDTTDDPAVLERLEWQAMLTSVLTGDVVKSEKTKIINNNTLDEQESFLHATYKESLWFGIRAKLLGRTEDDQRKIISYRRTLVDTFIEEILKFEISYDDPLGNPPKSKLKIY